MSHIACLLALVLLLFAGTFHEARAEKRVALIVGNSAYQHTTSLRNPVNDAKDISAALRDLGFEVITAIDAKAEQFDAALKQFAERLSGADVALFFYAGHGVQFSERNYLIPVDARLTDEFSLKRETTAADDVMQLLETGAHVNLMFLDACRNNPLAEQLKRSITAPTRAAQIGRGLARMETSGGDTLITFSTAPGDVADDGPGRNSPFADALLRHIKSPGVDVEVMLKRVTEDVRKATKERQRPERLSKLSKEFAFKPAEGSQPAAAKNNSNPEEELAYWNSVKDRQDSQLFEGYLERYPTGVFAAIARARIRELAEPSKQPQPKRDATIAYHEAIAKGTPEALRAFVEEFPDDPRVARVNIPRQSRGL